MHVELEIEDGRSFTGRLVGPDGVTIRFVGRLGLMAALEQLLEAGAPGPPQVSDVDRQSP